ncbi:MAG: hypothetical protein IJS08_04070 [Victivallales bacterium]|nr:hypothetical protein [Victivallales bacterium]
MREAFKNAHYGFFFHFLNTGNTLAPPPAGGQMPSSIQTWDEKVASFDVDRFATQLKELKADYAFITLGQNSGYYCSPNQYYDKLLGRRQTSKRDLVLDFANALEKQGIDLYVYTTSMCPMGDTLAIKALQALPPWNSNKNYGNYEKVKHLRVEDPRLKFFMNAWNEIHREWSLRFGKKVKGWWVDGCYFPKEMYDFPDEPNGASFMAAMRAGNPDAVITFNPGAAPPPRRNYPGDDEDYTAGEINNPQFNVLKGPYIDGLRYHILTYVGSTWGRGPVRGTGAELAALTRNITDTGGVVSWDLPFTTAGIDDDLFSVLKDFRDAYWGSLKAFPPIYVRITQPEKSKAGLLEIEADKKAQLNVTWGKQTRKMEIPGSLELPQFANGEQFVSIEKGGYSRNYSVWCGRQTIDLSDGKAQTFDNGKNARFTLQRRNGNTLYVTVDVREKKSIIPQCTTPWAASCLEIYLHYADGIRNQFAVLPDGTRVRILPQFRKMKSVPVTKIKGGYSYTFPMKVKENAFSLELRMQTFAGNARDFLPVNLFGGIASSATSKELHACIILKK